MIETIDAETTLETLFKEYPEVTDYLLSLGICECDGLYLRKTVAEVAEDRGMDVGELLRQIKRRIE